MVGIKQEKIMDKENLKALILTLKGIAPANYQSMERLVSSVMYLETLLEALDSKPKEEVKDG